MSTEGVGDGVSNDCASSLEEDHGNVISPSENELTTVSASDFDKLPPEMVKLILEYLGDSLEFYLACRLVCCQFKHLVDDILEKKQWSLWSWRRLHGESKPTDINLQGRIRRPLETGKSMECTKDVTKFLDLMQQHVENGQNPFPHRGIYFRLVRLLNYLFPQAIFERDNEGNEFCVGSPYDFSMAYPDRLTIEKALELLEHFGVHLSSMIFECGLGMDLRYVDEFDRILEKVPNIQYLMLKRFRMERKVQKGNKEEKTNKQEENELRPITLKYLKSIKIVQCYGITASILQRYHNQIESLQLLNHRDYWFPHFEKLWRVNEGNIFIKLKELKIGEFENAAEFDYFTNFLQKQPFLKLERLSIHYDLLHNLNNPVEKLFEMLEYLPKLEEFSVGMSGKTELVIDPEEERKPLKFTCASHHLTKISIPVQLYRHPNVVGKIVKNIPTLRHIRFLDCMGSFEVTENTKKNPLKLPKGVSELEMLQEILSMEDYRRISSISLVTFYREKERVVCRADRHMK